ncbi:MAG TPA: SIMPL domain-containing protein [Allosphingosinicella sp.]|jgi:hypothetical protein
MRNILAAVPLCLTAACGQAAADPRGVERDEVLVQIAASGRADTRPDEARFTAGVQTIELTAGAASARNSAVINRVVEALGRLGIRRDDVQTRQITLGRIDYGRDRGRYQANNIIEVRVRDIARAGAAIAAATDAGANVLSGPSLRLGDPEAASRSAYGQAFGAARARAEAYAHAAGLRVARVLAIRDLGGGGRPPPSYDTDLSAEEGMVRPVSAEPPPVEAGLTTSEVRVRVDFALAR